MSSHLLRRVSIATCASVLLFGAPAKSDAFWNWLRNCCQPRVAYMPVAPAPVAQTCQYVPVTSYRTVYKQVPVTTYQPVTSHSWCSCQPVTTYRPVTTYVTQAQQVPFTTYKPVFAAAATPAVTTYSAPMAAAVSYAQPAPSTACCGGGATMSAPPTYLSPAPSSSTYVPPAATSPGTTSPGYGAPTSQPSLPVNPPPGITTQKQTPSVAPPAGGQQTGYGNPPASTQPYIPQSERTASLPRYDRPASSYSSTSYGASQWQAQTTAKFAAPTNTPDRVAASQPAVSSTAAASDGGQFRWRPAQN